MKQCYQTVLNAAADAKLTKAEVKKVFDDVDAQYRKLSKHDPDWGSYTATQRLEKLAEQGVKDILKDKRLAARRVALTIQARSRLDADVNRLVETGVAKNKLEAINRIIAHREDNRSGLQSMDSRIKVTRDIELGKLVDALDQTRFFGLLEDKEAVANMVREMYGESTGHKVASSAAKDWKGVVDLLREIYNLAGGDIGKLDNWALPQSHSQSRIAKVGKDAWVEKILPKLDRSKYNSESGAPMTDVELRQLFSEIYDTVSTGGLNKINTSGHKGSGALSNRRSSSREIFFKDADSYMEYANEFSDMGIIDTMFSHINGMARDIGALETFGPNPELMFRNMIAEAHKEAVMADPASKNSIDRTLNRTNSLFETTIGSYTPVVPSRVGDFLDGTRSILTAAKLGSAALTTISDWGTMATMAHTNGMSVGKPFALMLKTLNPLSAEDRRFAQRMGLALETMTGSLVRLGQENSRAGLPHKISSTIMKISGLSKISDMEKTGYAVTMMSAVGHVVKHNTDLATLRKTSRFDADLIKKHGTNETDFAVWKLAEQDKWRGVDNLLTTESIMQIPDEKVAHLGNPTKVKFDAARKLLGMLIEETEIAVITPSVRSRNAMELGTKRGTVGGEIVRSITQFKSFPFTIVSKMFDRASSLPTGGQKAAFAASLLLSTTLTGGLALQLNNIAQGKQPQDMQEGKFWIESMLKGGALGLFGDLAFNMNGSYASNLAGMALGPLGSTIGQLADVTLGNARKLSQGKETSFGKDLVKLGKSVTPGGNLWYTKAITDHLLFNQLQEAVAPTSVYRDMRRAQGRGTEYWWKPTDLLPRGQ